MTQVEAEYSAKPISRDPAKIFPVSWDQFHRDSRALAIMAKTIYRELRGNGFHAKDVISLAGELLALVATDVRSSAAAKRGD